MGIRVTVLSMVDAVAEDLRGRLFSGALPAGRALTEAQIAGHYDIARPTAKAAIEQLVADGLLQRTVHKTARVPILGPDDVRDIYGIRAHLESETLRQLALKRLVPDGARLANARVLAAAGGTGQGVVEPDMQFHAALIDAVGSPRLSQMYGSLVQEVRLCMAQVQGRQLLPVELIAAEHQRILEHVQAGEGDAATSLLYGHLEHARERLVSALSGTNSASGRHATDEAAPRRPRR